MTRLPGRTGRMFLALLLTCLAAVAGAATVEDLGGGVTRYFASDAARDQARPSLCLAAPLAATGAPVATQVEPVFARVQGRASVQVDIGEGVDLYGTGEVPGPLRRNGTRTVAWNTDAYAWHTQSLSLYQSHPWVLAVRPDGTAFGVLADTPQRCLIDLRAGIRFEANGPEFPVLVVEGDSPQAVVRKLAGLIGTMPLPPRWALGYHQCRYSYTPDDRVREVARTFRDRDIPCDVIWFDIDYMDGYRCFTVNTWDFPDMRSLVDELHGDGFHTVAIIDPGIKLEPGYHVYDSGDALDAWVRTAQGDVYQGHVWPGNCVFPDFTRADVRAWWGGLYAQYLQLGIDGVWNDMNEPAVFNVDSKTMPVDNRHAADPELGGPDTHARYHNVYGMLMARGTWEGCRDARPDRRPFVLTRANHLGGQRWAATWTGDNVADWIHLDMSISMVLNLGLSGQPMAGPDIGGFAGAGDGRLFARWMGIGALLPFARGHTGKGNIDKEPWAFGPGVEATCRRALQIRYRLLPYLYTLMREAERSGLPPLRPLFFADPADPRLRGQDDAFLMGDDLLVACRTRPDAPLPDVFPAGQWRRISLVDGDLDDPDLPALFLREGAALPLGPVMEFSGERPLDAIELVTNPGPDGRAVGVLYEDDGDGYGYRDGACRTTRYVVSGGQVERAVIDGTWPAAERPVTVRPAR
ncbi:MAG TPA: glycoside hydrolase family 31 protein [Candidatus Krumholzibacteria bacterium]|nr:glycoside hydrolase family 31 protein [Candidatus Krumholzibacteria bacterium]